MQFRIRLLKHLYKDDMPTLSLRDCYIYNTLPHRQMLTDNLPKYQNRFILSLNE